MHRIDSEGSVNGTFSEGDPGLGVLGTKVSADWLNDLQEAICYVIEASGLTLEKGNNALLANAIEAFFESGNFTALETRIRNLNSSYLFGADRIIRSNTMPVEDPSNPFKDNDIWVDTSVQPNVTYQWNSLTKTWTNVGSVGGGQSVLVAQKLEAISDGVVDIFVRDTAPTVMSEGDIWYNDKEDILWFFEDGQWVRVYDQFVRNTIVNSIINAAAKDAASLADAKIRTFYQPTPPTGLSGTDNGDLWFDIDDGNKIYRYTHPQWIEVKDKNITKAFDLLYLQSAISDGSINVYFSTVQPTASNQAALDPPQSAPNEGDLWIDISLNSSNQPRNNPYLYDDGIWKLQTDPQLRSFLLSFANYRSIMDGKVTVYFSETEPDDTFRPAPAYGDIWFDTSEETIPDPDAEDPEANPIGVPRYKQYRYDPSKVPKWIPVEDFSIKLLFANLKTTEKALTEADTAIAASLTEAYTEIGENQAAITQALVSIDGIASSYGVVTNVNNKIVGFGFLTDYESEISYTKPVGALNFRPSDQVFIGTTWETRTWDAKIVTVDNVNHEMKVISEIGTYQDGVEIKVRDRLDAKGDTVSRTANPNPGTSEFEIMVDRFKVSDGTSTYTPLQIVNGIVYIGSVDTSTPQITYIGEFASEPPTADYPINSVYRNSTNGNSYILNYVSGNSGPKVWNDYIRQGSNAKLMYLSSNSPYFTFADNSESSPTNTTLKLIARYQGLTAPLALSDIAVYNYLGVEQTSVTFDLITQSNTPVTDTDGLKYNGSIEFSLDYSAVSSVSFPITIKSEKDGLADDLEISKLTGSRSVTVSVSPDTFFFLFESDIATTPQNEEIVFSINHQNVLAAPTASDVEIVDDSAASYSPTNFVSSSTPTGTSTFSLPWASLTSATFPITITVVLDDVSDSVTIRKLVGGVDAITGLLTNESHVVPADETGALPVGALNDANGYFDIYRGIDKQNSSYTYSVYSATGATATIDSTGLYQIITMTANRATVTFQAIESGVPIRKTMSLAKSIAGVNARTLVLTGSALAFEFDGDNKVKDAGASITFTSTAVNLSGVTWTSVNDSGASVTLTGSGSTRALSVTNFADAQWVKVSVTASHNSITYTDSVTIYRLRDAQNSIQVILTNEAHNFSANNDGFVSDYEDGNSTVLVYRGLDPVAYSATPTNDAWRFGTFTPVNVTRNTSLAAPELGISDLSNAFGTLDFQVIYRDALGVDVTLTRRLSYTKTVKGTPGLDGVTVTQSNPSTSFSTDKNGTILPGVSYDDGDTTVKVFNGDEELQYTTVSGIVNTFTISNIVATGATRDTGIALPTLGISGMSANNAKLTANIIPYTASIEIVDYGFERGSVGVNSSPYGWTLSGTDITQIGYSSTVSTTSNFNSTLSFGASGTSATGATGWKLGKRLSIKSASYLTINAKVRASRTPYTTWSGTSGQSHYTTDDVFAQVEYFSAAGTLLSTVNSRTLSHKRFVDDANTASYAGTWVTFSHTFVSVPSNAVLAKVYFVSSYGGASGSIQTTGYINTATSSNVLIDDVEFVSDGSLYDTTRDRLIPLTVNYSRSKTGQDAVLYYIKPNNGTAIKNNAGAALTGELRRIEGLSDTAVTSGTVKLYKAGVDLGYTYSQTASDISGSAVIEARNGAAGTIYDTLTLLDVSDGLGGGVVEASNGFSLIQPSSEILTFTPASTVLTASFYAPGTTTSPIQHTATVSADFSGTTPRLRWVDGGGSSLITVTAKDNNGTSYNSGAYASNATSLTLSFAYIDAATGQVSSISETVFRTNAGTRGSRQFYATTAGTTWSDTLANAAITATGATKVLNDIVTLSNAAAGFSQTRFWDGAAWLQIAQVIDGNLVVQGTLGADRIASGLIQTALLTLGPTARVLISGTDENIIVKDTNDVVRVRLGKLGASSFGINIYNSSGGLIMSSGGVEASAINGSINWLTQISNAPKTFRILSHGASSTSHPVSAGVYGADGVSVATANRSYNVVVINRSTKAIVSTTTYDVFASTANATAMANALNALASDRIVLIYSFNDPKPNRLTGGLPAAIYRCGGSTSVFGNENKFKVRGAYVLVGIPGIGEGNGTEIYRGETDNDVNAWIDTNVTINSDGSVNLGSSSPRNANDLLYTNGQTVGSLQPLEGGATVGAIAGTNLRDSGGSVLTDALVITSQGTSADSRTNASTWRNAFEGGDISKWTAQAGTTLTSTSDSFDGTVAGNFYSTATLPTPTGTTYVYIPRSYSPQFSGSVRRVANGSTESVNQRIEVSVFAKRGSATDFAVQYVCSGITSSPWQTFTTVAGAWRQFKFTFDVPPTAASVDHYISILGSSTGGNLYTTIDAVSVRTLPSVEETQNAGFWARLNTAITAGNISTYIQSAAIGNAYIVDLHGSKITADSITATQLAAGSVTANEISVTNLSAISSDLGSVTAGSLNIGAGRFSVDAAGNVTIRNAATGQRLEISNSLLQVFDSSGVRRVRLGIWT